MIDLWLRRYRELLVVATTGTVRAIVYDREIVESDAGDPLKLIDIKADIDRALLQLSQLDENPRAAMWIRDCYLDGRSTDRVADSEGCSQSTVQKTIACGRTRMAQILGWKR